jgi:hypothetical protein
MPAGGRGFEGQASVTDDGSRIGRHAPARPFPATRLARDPMTFPGRDCLSAALPTARSAARPVRASLSCDICPVTSVI